MKSRNLVKPISTQSTSCILFSSKQLYDDRLDCAIDFSFGEYLTSKSRASLVKDLTRIRDWVDKAIKATQDLDLGNKPQKAKSKSQTEGYMGLILKSKKSQ